MIGSIWVARSRRLRELETDATIASLRLDRAVRAREAAEGALTTARAELAKLPETVKEAEAAAVAANVALEEARREATAASRDAADADLIHRALQSSVVRIGTYDFEGVV